MTQLEPHNRFLAAALGKKKIHREGAGWLGSQRRRFSPLVPGKGERWRSFPNKSCARAGRRADSSSSRHNEMIIEPFASLFNQRRVFSTLTVILTFVESA